MKISIKIQLQIVIFVFLFFLTDSTAIAKGKQTIEIPDVMRIPDGYFDPHIKVCETAQTSKCKTFRPDDCYYIFPTHVKVQQAFCIDSCFNSDGKCENDSSSTTETENHKIPCLCAKQATSCGVLDIGKIKLGCIRIPNPPPPPIFYEKFPENPIIGIVPVSTQNDNSFSTPKIGAKIVGSSTSYDILDGNRTEIQNIQYGKTNFSFKVKVVQGQICGNYLGYIDVNQNSPVKLEECFQLPGAKKPMGLRYDGQFLIADTNPDNVKFTQIFPRTVLNAVDAQECKDYNCKIGDFFAGYTCKSKKDKTNVCNGGSFVDGENGLECKNGVEPCPPEYNLQLEYQLDNRSNIICADGWQPNPARYVLSDDPENKIFVETQNAFVSYQSKGPGEWERSDYPNIGLGLTKKFYIVQQELEQVDILLNLVD